MNLRYKLALVLLMCGLAPLLAYTLASTFLAQRALRRSDEESRTMLLQRAEQDGLTLISTRSQQVQADTQKWRSDLTLLASNESIQRACSVFGRAFGQYVSQSAVSPADLERGQQRLLAFYDTVFLPSLASMNGSRMPSAAELAGSLSPAGLLLQIDYIADNPRGPEARGVYGRAPAPTAYNTAHESEHPYITLQVNSLGYDDLYLIDVSNDTVVYSMAKDPDFATSLTAGPFAGTALSRAYRRAKALPPDSTDIVFEDFSAYAPAGDEPVAFLAAPLRRAEVLVGIIALRIDGRSLNAIVAQTAGLGETGEVFLVGPDLLPRTNVPRDTSGKHRVAAAFRDPESGRIESPAIRAALDKTESGLKREIDYRGIETLVAYAPVQLFGVTWAMIAKIDVTEAFGPIQEMTAKAERRMNAFLWLSLMFALAAAFTVFFLGMALSAPVIKPLRQTVEMMRDIASGDSDLSRRLTVRTGGDEVGELSVSFNTFMDKLSQIYTELEHKTRSLEKYQRELKAYSENLEQEIADRRRAQSELLRSEAYHKALIEYAPDVIVVLDADRETVRFLSPSFFRSFGYSPEDLESMHVRAIVHPDDQKIIEDAQRQSIEKPGQPIRMEVRWRHANGDYRWVSVTGTSHIGDPTVNGVVLNLRDVTERKKAERVLRDYNERLEKAVRDRTAELQREQAALQKALDELRDMQDKLVLNEKLASLGALTAGIAHEIRNPLNFVNNFAEVGPELVAEVRAEIEPHKEALGDAAQNLEDVLRDLEENARRILQHGKRADSIVRNMLLHSRGRAGERASIDINALVDEYVHLAYHGMRAQDARFQIDLDLDYDRTLPEIPVVPQDMARVVLNLVNNGCYAASERRRTEGPEFRPRLEVTTRQRDGFVEIHVRDNGTGISPEIRSQIFTPFFTTNAAGQGSGLGLSICYDIVVQQHGGEIDVVSEPGAFTEFIVRLPIHPNLPAPPPAAAETLAAAPGAPPIAQ